jgi:hypothetical protein
MVLSAGKNSSVVGLLLIIFILSRYREKSTEYFEQHELLPRRYAARFCQEVASIMASSAAELLLYPKVAHH